MCRRGIPVYAGLLRGQRYTSLATHSGVNMAVDTHLFNLVESEVDGHAICVTRRYILSVDIANCTRAGPTPGPLDCTTQGSLKEPSAVFFIQEISLGRCMNIFLDSTRITLSPHPYVRISFLDLFPRTRFASAQTPGGVTLTCASHTPLLPSPASLQIS